MFIGADSDLAERRRILRQQLHLQRQVIAQNLENDNDKVIKDSNYPRSIMMQILMRRPDLAVKVIKKVSRYFY